MAPIPCQGMKHWAMVLLCHQRRRSFRATRTSLSVLFMESSETDDLHLALARPLTGSAFEVGNVVEKCRHDQQSEQMPKLRLLPSSEVFYIPYRGRVLETRTCLSRPLAGKYILA